MKALLLAAALFVMPALASAQTRITDPVEAFRKADPVMVLTANLFVQGAVIDKDAGAALLSAGCGFAGCESTYLVTLGYSTQGSNPQTSVIAALVTIRSWDEPIVKLTSVADLLK